MSRRYSLQVLKAIERRCLVMPLGPTSRRSVREEQGSKALRDVAPPHVARLGGLGPPYGGPIPICRSRFKVVTRT
jgi:hypothetical protein